MQLEARIATHTAEVEPVDWDQLDAHHPFASHAWYRKGEDALAPSPRWYLQIYDGGELIARATFWLVRDEPLPVAGLERLAMRCLLSVRPLLVCRSPIAFLPGLILPDDSRRLPALKMICQLAAEIATKQHASFTTFDFLDPTLLKEDWKSLGYSRADVTDAGTCLVLENSSFEDFLRCLPKPAFKDYRRHTNQARARQIEVTIADRVSDIPAALKLVRQVERRHRTMPVPWARALLEFSSRGGVSWLAARQENRLVGCGLILEDRGVHLATLLGLDDRVEYVYFQLMYAAIRNAIESGARALRAGSGAYSFKQRLGFQLEDYHHLVFSGSSRIFQRLGRMMGADKMDNKI